MIERIEIYFSFELKSFRNIQYGGGKFMAIKLLIMLLFCISINDRRVQKLRYESSGSLR